jgi:hypothetical protein
MTTDSDMTQPSSRRARARKVAAATTSTAVPDAAKPKPIPTTVAAPTKSATVIKLLLRAKGATLLELIAATDWQPHSVRAFLSGLRKKRRVLAREPRKNGEPAYRIVVTTGAGGDNVSPPPVATLPGLIAHDSEA